MHPRLHTWLQLFRAPNLFTVPGDPLAGLLLASPALAAFSPRMLIPILASLCFYAGGLLLNDLMDLEEDRRDRPKRPLPSGAAQPSHVWIVTVVLMVLGLGLSAIGGKMAIITGAFVVLCVVAYDCWLKKVRIAGVIAMGFCRGGSVFLGAAFAPPPLCQCPATGAAVAITIYIATVTQLASFETTAGAPAYAIALPLLGPIAMLAAMRRFELLPIALLLLAAGMIISIQRRVWKKQLPLPPSIGALIRVLLVIQAFYCLYAPASVVAKICAILLLALWPISRVVSKRFYAS